MRLKSIKLAGFKSFVDPTTVNFPSNLCAVVGPNGCGKSNIIDAVRWVMGESSAKNLRGEAMTDVIFNGSGNRKPVGQASIELIFDNSSGTITGEYAGFNEISVKRRVTRDASNTYFLNGQKCRRRDITDIFLGTGLGPRSYAIIEQGMISRLIEAKPEELRIYIEEAAGISKYKERRRDTENRMRRTHENLERLTDLRDELERQLNRLERQAAAAEKYTVLKKQERELKALSRALQWSTLDQQREQRAKQISELELGVEAVVTEQVNLESGIEKFRVEATDLGDTFNEVQARFYGIGNDITRLEQAIQFGQERERSLRADLGAIDLERQRIQESLELDKAKLEGFELEREELAPEAEMLKDNEEDSQEALLSAEEAMRTWQQEWDEFTQRAAEPRQQAEVQQSRIKYLEQVQQRLLERVGRLSSERDAVELGDHESEIEAHEAEVEELQARIEASEEELAGKAETRTKVREQLQDRQSERDSQRDSLQQAKGRLSSLEALQKAALGSDTKAFDRWLQQAELHNNKRLAQEIKAAPGWATALEAVLGDALQAVCVDNVETHAASLASLSEGNITLVAKRSDKAAGDTNGRVALASKVTGDYSTTVDLNKVFCAESLEDALDLQASLAADEVCVTKQGELLGHSWLASVNKSDAKAGMLEREDEIKSLTAKINSLEEALQALEQNIAELRDNLQNTENDIELQRKQRDDTMKSLSEKKSRLSQLTSKVEQALETKRRAVKDIDEAQAQMALEGENLSQARLVLEDAIAAMEGDTEQRERLMQDRDKLRESLDRARLGAKEKRERAYAAATRLNALQTQIASVKDAMTRLEEQDSRIDERRESLSEQLESFIDPSDDKQVELEGLLSKRVNIESELKTARSALEETESVLREREQQRQQVQNKLGQLRTHLESERLEAKTLSVQSETLRNQLVEDGFELEALIENAGTNVSFEEVEDQLADTTRKVERLGPINLAAIDEFKQESERKEYLDSQNQDLCEALETLENAILRIDKETRARFKDTFDSVNSGLQELFPKVFGGGSASLELTGEDLLDTGIAIMARPPGKKNSTIHLLSGGEKALTAIALVFSIFRLNPAPFCMLDEVDAPLDDANVGRYARMVEQMSDQVQFIYISHNKIAMEMAHQLMGVTMHEPGVSRMVTVDVEEAAELASA